MSEKVIYNTKPKTNEKGEAVLLLLFGGRPNGSAVGDWQYSYDFGHKLDMECSCFGHEMGIV